MITGRGSYPNHRAWLKRRRSLEPLIKTQIWADKDVSENTMWNDWFFKSTTTTPMNHIIRMMTKLG